MSAATEPRTSSTVEAAADGEVGAQAGRGWAEGEGLAGAQGDDAVVADGGAVDGRRGRGARQRHGAQAVRAHGEAAEEHLDGGGALVVVGDEAVGQAQRRAVGGAGAGHARPPRGRGGRGPARARAARRATTSSARRGTTANPAAAAARSAIAAGVALGAWPSVRSLATDGTLLRLGLGSRARDEADLRPGRQQRGRGAGGVPEHGVGAADQLPAARRAAGVDAAELAREPDRPGRDARARLRPTLDVQPGVAAGQVGEAGREAAEPDPPRRAGVRGHHLVDVEPGQLGDLGQVRAVVDDRDLDGLAVGRVDRRDVQRLDGPAQRAEVGARADGDDHGPRSRHDVDHARPARRLDRGGVGEHGVEVGELHEDRRVPHRPHPRPHRSPPGRRSPAQTNACSSTPAAARPSRTAVAISTAPGESPCTHADSARTAHVGAVHRGDDALVRPSAPPAPSPPPGRAAARRPATAGRARPRACTRGRRRTPAPRAAPPSRPPRAAGSRAGRAPAAPRRTPARPRPPPAPAPRGGPSRCTARRAA